MDKLIPRLFLVMLCAILPPAAIIAAQAPLGLTFNSALAAAAATALLCAAGGAYAVFRGLGVPVRATLSAVKCFVAADFKLDCPLPKTGWPAAAELITVLNRLMLELSAYRAFHLNQMMDERAKAQALIETITDGVMLTDHLGQVLYCNQVSLRLLGIQGRMTAINIPASVQNKEFVPALEGIFKSSESEVRAEVALAGENGDDSPPKSYLLLSRNFHLTTLKLPGRVIVLRDITVEKEIESARETFFHMITHDMRTPLTSIQGYAQILKKKLAGSSSVDVDKHLNSITNAATRLNGMIADILNTIKLERGDMVLNLTPIDPETLCAGIFEAYEPLAARKNIAFTFQVADKTPFQGDASLLDRVLANLVGNALKFTPSGGKLLVSCRREDTGVLFSVEDNGRGIPPEKHEEIFKKYAQMEEHKFMGFGLGLALCKMVVELHKGRIWVESSDGKGSRFCFRLPAAQG